MLALLRWTPPCALWAQWRGVKNSWAGQANVRVLVDEAGAVVDLVVDDNVQVLLGGVLGDIRVGEFLGRRHCGGGCVS